MKHGMNYGLGIKILLKQKKNVLTSSLVGLLKKKVWFFKIFSQEIYITKVYTSK